MAVRRVPPPRSPDSANPADLRRPAPISDIRELARSVERATGDLARAAVARMQTELPWFSGMPADQRASIALLVQSGLRGFAEWLQTPEEGLRIGGEVFATAPGELARLVTLQQTVDLVRLAVDVAEASVTDLAPIADQPWLRDAVLRYSRDIAFTVAMVYARAAEQRGAWDARLEALVVDGIVRGDSDDALLSRAAALGWSAPTSVVVLAGSAPSGEPERIIEAIHQRAAAVGAETLAGVQGDRLIVLVGTTRRLTRVIRGLLPGFGSGPVVVGQTVASLAEAPQSARAALAGLKVAHAWPTAPRPVASDDLLPERALSGDADAIAALRNRFHAPLAAEPVLLETVEAFLEHGGSIEATARALWVHPNTVRYRLGRVNATLGRDVHDSRDLYAVRLAMSFGRMDPAL